MTIKIIIVFCFFFLSTHSFAQKYILADGEFMDTTINKNTICKDYELYFYQVGCKYPRSSSTTLKELLSFLNQKNKMYEGSGYISFQFKIDCAGKKLKRTQVLQTDEQYKNYHFDKELVLELSLFLNSLDQWNIAKNKEGQTFVYKTFITFKIKNGKVINIIP